MIRTDGSEKRKKKVAVYYDADNDLKRLQALRPQRKKTRGKEKVEDECCDCDIQLDPEFTEGTIESFLFYENPKNHPEFCFYRILCKA